MKLYCRSCKFHTTMEYDIYTHNFICQKCDKLLIGSHGYEILEFDDAGDLELYVTRICSSIYTKMAISSN